MNYDELDYKYKTAIEQYELNSEWAEDVKTTILTLKNPKEIVLDCLIDKFAEYYHEMMCAETTLLHNGFSKKDIFLLSGQYYDKCVK